MLLEQLASLVKNCFAEAGFSPEIVDIEPSHRPTLGEFQCNAALSLARIARQPPRVIASAVLPHLRTLPQIRDVTIDGPGYINFSVADAFLTMEVERLRGSTNFGGATNTSTTSRTVLIDYGGPNVAKAMHVGHIRSGIIGDTLRRLGKFVGDRVIGDIHLGDWGMPIGMLIAEIKRRSPELPYFDSVFDAVYPPSPPVTVDELNSLYPQAVARCNTDKAAMLEARAATAELQQGHRGYRALWRHIVNVSVAAIREEFALLDISFDLWHGESSVNERLPKLIDCLEAQGMAQRNDGAIVVPVAREEDNKPMPPLILEKTDGGVTYAATDLATIKARVEEFDPDAILYVVDQRQHLHFDQVFRAAEKSKIIRSGRPCCQHISFGTINGPDGKPFKTRSGGVMRLRDLVSQAAEAARGRLMELGLAQDMDEAEREEVANLIGIAMIRFADLSHHRKSDYVFNIEKFSRFEGKTGPYLCYAAVRAGSILARATGDGFSEGSLSVPISERVREVYLSLLDFGRVVDVAYSKRVPNVLCDHAYDLAQKFNSLYHQHHILSEDNAEIRSSLLALTRLVREQLQVALNLLGIEVPRRM